METLERENTEKVENLSSQFTNTSPKSSKRPIPYLPHTAEDRKEMLDFLGIKSVENLLEHVPKELRDFELKIPNGKSEAEIIEEFRSYSKKNISLSDQMSFCGGGVYNRFIPAVVNEIISKGEFYTAYTPYQPEVSQGTLQAIYEFQSVICNLTEMDACNASLYDGLTAVIEAALMCKRITNRNKILISKSIHPEAQEISKTYAWGADLELRFIDSKDGVTDLEKLKDAIDKDTACFITANPNFAGCLEPVEEIAAIVKRFDAKLVLMVDLISLAILKTPRELGADIAVGDGQQAGNFPGYGGPHVGFICCLKDYIRQLPGRLVGLTKDIKGNRAFTLTLQTREQHIRREKATSNICTNQSLNALAVLVYLSYMGPYGLRKIAEISLKQAHYLYERLESIGLKRGDYNKDFKGNKAGRICRRAFSSPFFNEFVLELPISTSEFISKMSVKNILPGLDLSNIDRYKSNHILVSVTEMNTMDQIKHYVKSVEDVLM